MFKKVEFNPTRMILYVLGRLLIVALVAALVIFALSTANSSMDVYVMTKDAFTRRNSVLLKPLDNKDTQFLPKLFTEEYLNKTSLDTQTVNASYDVTNYDERIKVTFTVIFPWQKTAKVSVENIVLDIKAKVNTSQPYNPVTELMESGKYTATAERDEDGNWKISDIRLDEKIQPESTLPIPVPEKEADFVSAEETVETAAETETEEE